MRFRTSPMFLAYSRDWLTISSARQRRALLHGDVGGTGTVAPPAEGGAIGAGAGPCANTVLAMKVVVSRTFAFTTAPFLSPNTPEGIPTKSDTYELGRQYSMSNECQPVTNVSAGIIVHRHSQCVVNTPDTPDLPTLVRVRFASLQLGRTRTQCRRPCRDSALSAMGDAGYCAEAVTARPGRRTGTRRRPSRPPAPGSASARSAT